MCLLFVWCTRNVDKIQICMVLKKPKLQFRKKLVFKGKIEER